ncbi:MAG: hypothetical protein O4965_05515 [Trichodesmium sp. St19_bin1]|nr:hypothetical protein [Trichodesmium sp. St19_bin1]
MRKCNRHTSFWSAPQNEDLPVCSDGILDMFENVFFYLQISDFEVGVPLSIFPFSRLNKKSYP